MKTRSFIEVTVRYQVVPSKRVSPFHWALLKALKCFPPEARPSLDEFCARLHLGDRIFLDKAWGDLCAFSSCDDKDFSQARLSLDGEEALKSGFFHLGPVEERSRALVFDAVTGESAGRMKVRADPSTPGQALPFWTAQLDRVRLEQILRDQAEAGSIKQGERVLSCQAQWSSARLVRAS